MCYARIQGDGRSTRDKPCSDNRQGVNIGAETYTCDSLGLDRVLRPPAGAPADSAEEQVTAAYAAWNEAFNKGDAAALAAFYDDEAVLLPPSHDVLEGPAGVEKFFGGLFANGVTGHGLELIEVEGEDDDDLVVAAAKWSA